jgi:hypothetical protein
MLHAIAKSALDLDTLGSARALFRLRQPVDLVYASIYVSSFRLHGTVGMLLMHMRSMLSCVICLLHVYVSYMF